MSLDRRGFLKTSLMGAAALGVLPKHARGAEGSSRQNPGPSAGRVVDTNVHLFHWPFRHLKYSDMEAMTQKLSRHGVRQAWAGSFEALFHKNIDSVNARLAEACHEGGDGRLIPFGTVNPRWPDWEEDLRRCDEEYDMPGIRIYPSYQNYDLEFEGFPELLQAAAERDMIVQIAIDMEDERMQHPMVEIPAVDVSPLPEALQQAPGVKVQLLNPFRHVRGERLQLMVNETDVVFGTSNLDGTGGLERIMAGNHWYLRDVSVPSTRLLIGSHMPFRPLEGALFKMMESEMSREEADDIMAGNADRLLGRA